MPQISGTSTWQENLHVGKAFLSVVLKRYSVGSKSCNILEQKDVASNLKAFEQARSHTVGPIHIRQILFYATWTENRQLIIITYVTLFYFVERTDTRLW